jgi:hypothetical protein
MKSKQDREAEISIAKTYAEQMLSQGQYQEAASTFSRVAILIGQLQIEELFRSNHAA